VDYRWNLIPDGDGNMHLIDLNRAETEPEAFFNPEVDTAFLLFTRANPTVPQRITWTPESISGSNYNPAHPVRFLIHGFNSGQSSGVNIAPTASYLRLGEYNVIV
jgi:pancreatic triacylglycerol lipase